LAPLIEGVGANLAPLIERVGANLAPLIERVGANLAPLILGVGANLAPLILIDDILCFFIDGIYSADRDMNPPSVSRLYDRLT